MKALLTAIALLLLCGAAEAKSSLNIKFEPSPGGEMRWATWKWCGISYNPNQISDTEARMFFEYEMTKVTNCARGDKHHMKFAIMVSDEEFIGYFYEPKGFEFLDNDDYMETVRVRTRKLATIFGKEFRIGFREPISKRIVKVVSSND